MTLNEFIESGILEEFAMGLLDEEGKREVMKMANDYPQVREELDKIFATLAILDSRSSVSPPPHIKRLIMSLIEFTDGKKKLNPKFDLRQSGYRNLLLTTIFSSLVFGLTAYIQYDKSRKNKHEVDRLEVENNRIIHQCDSLSGILAHNLHLVNNNRFQRIHLKSLTNDDLPYAFIYWNKRELYICTSYLPKVTGNEQYQLWGIHEGNPIDAGVINPNESGKVLSSMLQIEDASAFAITLEPFGGSIKPTLEKMIVYGDVSI